MELDNLLMSVCDSMVDSLNEEQMKKLHDVLFVKFHGIRISPECYALDTTIDTDDQKLIDYFKASKTISGRANSTLLQYEREINSLRGACRKKINNIESSDVKYYLAMCKTLRKNSMCTIQSKVRYLNSFFTFLQKEGFIKDNPMNRIETIKVEHRIKHAFSAEEIEKIRLSCTNLRDRALFEFLLATGLRLSELVSLNIGDIDLYNQEFTVVGKGNKERSCYFNDVAAFHLLRYVNDRLEKEKIPLDKLKERPLFVSTNGKHRRLTNRGVQKIFQKLGRDANIEDIHPHKCRRTYATNLSSKGCSIQDLKVLMGHAEIGTTMQYIDVQNNNIKNVYRMLNSASA